MKEPCLLEAYPARDQADRPFRVMARGLKPGSRATVRARTVDEGGREWETAGVFRADAGGDVDLSLQAPESGGWSVPDPGGLLWSLRPARGRGPVPLFRKNGLEPVRIDLSLETDGQTAAAAGLERRFLPPGGEVVREPVDENGVTGVFFHPAGGGPRPVVVCLSGSGGGVSEPRAALLAARGYAALALAYFGSGSLPRSLSEIPLEFFDRARTWLAAHPAADDRRLALYGFSKGGELALLLASFRPEVRAVASFSGSSRVWQGLKFGRPASSWTRGGAPVPFLPFRLPAGDIARLLLGRPVAFERGYSRGLAAAPPGAAAIAAGRIRGAVLAVAGTGDRVWPAADFARELEADRKIAGTGCRLLVEDAGHLVALPYLPPAQICRNLIFS
ncbi:MAG TPA: acyl-CoA thioesterase/BAAT N-terminal domain-containing protein, partial [bacterium]|nr:acyl-CoA thioesterase/BAAT N-terminal domain-containing protein [bacterium]